AIEGGPSMKSGIARSVLLLGATCCPSTLKPAVGPGACAAGREREVPPPRWLLACASRIERSRSTLTTLVQGVLFAATISGSAVAGTGQGPCAAPAALAGDDEHSGMVWIEGGTFTMGDDD